MALRQHRHAGDATAAAEFMDVDVQNGCARDFRCFAERALHQFRVVETARPPVIHQQVSAGVGLAVLTDEVIPHFVRGLGTHVFMKGITSLCRGIAMNTGHRSQLSQRSGFHHP